MRKTLFAAFVLVTSVRSASAQTYPAEMVITSPEVEVRSGPTKEYLPTSKLRYADRVLVLRPSEKDPSWLAIRPPQGSFSWVNAKGIKQINATTGVVEAEGGVTLMPGSTVINKAPNAESVKIPQGSIVIILDKGRPSDGNTWLPIQPWPTEVRFIPGDAVQARQPQPTSPTNPNVFAGGGPTPPGSNAPANAFAVSQPPPGTQQVQSKPPQAPWVPGNPNQMAQTSTWPTGQPVGQTASFVKNAPAPQATMVYPPQWSDIGILRAAFDRDGQPTYVLQNQRGQVLIYVTCQQGFTLRDYVGKTVRVYGSVNYRSDDYLRTHFVTASHVAVY